MSKINIIFISADFFSFELPVSKGLVSFAKKLSSSNYQIFSEITKIADFTFKILQTENIKVKNILDVNKDTELDTVIFQKNRIEYNKKEFDDFIELTEYMFCKPRIAKYNRETNETNISIELNLDGVGKSDINTGIGFFDHMLEQISRHANLDLSIKVKGDLNVDEHHTVEDTGIALGETIIEALGNKKGITRYGFFLPMDETIAKCALDISGRSFLNFKCKFEREKVGEFPTELTKEFFRALANGLKANLYLRSKGKNDHHKIEALFKVFAKSLNEACRLDERTKGIIPSTKGVI